MKAENSRGGIRLARGVISFPVRFRCEKCGSENYYVWGTSIGNNFRLEVRCIRCGQYFSRFEEELCEKA